MEEHEHFARTVHFLRRGDSFGVSAVVVKLSLLFFFFGGGGRGNF